VTAIMVALLFVVVLADYFLNLNALPRIVFTLAAIAGIGVAFYRWIIESLLSPLSLNDVASRVEKTFPQFQDRLLSTVDILDGKQISGSEIMSLRVVAEAMRLTETLDINRVLVSRPVWYANAVGVFALLVLAICIAVTNPVYVQIARNRLLSPFTAHPWPLQVVIEPVGSVPDRVAVGDRVEFQMRLSRGGKPTRKAVIYYQYQDEKEEHSGPVQQEYMNRGSDGVYHSAINSQLMPSTQSGTLKVWMQSGDGELVLHTIKVVQRLAISQVQAFIAPPPYANLPAVRFDLSQSPCRLVSGSKVQLTVTFNKLLDTNHAVTAEVLESPKVDAFGWSTPSGNSATAEITPVESFRFRLHAIDADGLSTLAAEEYQFVVRPDALPTVSIESPRGNLDCTPEATVPLQIVAEDDFGISDVKLVVNRTIDKKRWEVPLVASAAAVNETQWKRVDSTTEIQRFHADYMWDLATSNEGLHPGDILEYNAQATDNYILNGSTHPSVSSGKLRIVIVSQDEFSNKVADELNAVAEQLSELKKSQLRTERETVDLQKQISSKPSIDAADKAAGLRIGSQQGSIASQTKSLAAKLDELHQRMEQNKSDNQELKATSNEVGSLLNSAAENSMKQAAGSVADSMQAMSKSSSVQKLADADANQNQAIDKLRAAMDRLGNIAGLSKTIEGVKSLLADQQKLSSDTAAAGKQTLGKSRDELTSEERTTLEAISVAQNELGNRTRKMLSEMARNAKSLAKSDALASKAMTQAGTTGSNQDVAGQQSTAAAATAQNQQDAAQTAQQQAEQGLQSMLDDLNSAQKQKLSESSEKLAKKQEELASLIRRQAGHNLDNLLLEGGDINSHIGTLSVAQLYKQAERDADAPGGSKDIIQLTSAQEQTEHDARSVAKSTEAMDDGIDAADHLTKAADRMERAVVYLRDGKLLDAYSPPETEALVELLTAKLLVDQQKQAADDQQEDQQKATIKQAYQALLVQQTALNVLTAEIDVSPKNSDGSRRRADLIRVAQLPGMQQAVIDGASALDDPLSKLGSIVYSWANRDIVKNMMRVKSLLDNNQTGVDTQTQQTRVAAAIKSMIDNLVLKPKKAPPGSPIENEGKGTPPPPGAPQMPSEAEFRLMKDLQLQENATTIALSKQSSPAQADFVEAGHHQGELRDLLDKLIQKASKGKARLRPDTDTSQHLPEENGIAQTRPAIKDGAPTVEELRDANLIGTRMSRARQLLSAGDAGDKTRAIQCGIIYNLNTLIEQTRQNEPQPGKSNPPKPKPKPKRKTEQEMASGAQPENSSSKGQGAASVGTAKSASGNGGDGAKGEPGADLAKQEARNWGDVSPRERDAVIEGQGENVLDKYKSLVDDYYRTMSTQSDEH
jgi:hypothetical protein